jgi:sugar/nucleoside kinase (ribokinase family)
MILVFGSLNIDLVAHVPVIPGPGRTVLAPSYRTHFGGKGANQAVAAARIAGPGRVRMAGRIGRDGFGDRAVEISEQTASTRISSSDRTSRPAVPSSWSIRPVRMQ